jgi:hypothetical protein
MIRAFRCPSTHVLKIGIREDIQRQPDALQRRRKEFATLSAVMPRLDRGIKYSRDSSA